MAPLQNSCIEFPEKIFEVELVVYGSTNRSAANRTIKVMARTAQGARRICKLRYQRSEIRSAREIRQRERYVERSLFPDLEF